MQSDKDRHDFFNKKDECRDGLNFVTPKKGPSNRLYEDIILQCLPPENDRIHQTHFEREECHLADIRRMMSKMYADNLACSNSDSSRGIAGSGIAMQATGRGLSIINDHYCVKFGHYKNDCASFEAAHQQNQQRRKRQQKQRRGHQPHQQKPGAQQQPRGGNGAILRPPPTAMPIAVPGRQTDSTVTLTSSTSILRVLLGSVARVISLCEVTPMRSSASHCWRERSSLRPSPPTPVWRGRRGLDHSTQPRQQRRRGGKFDPGHFLSVPSRVFPLVDR